MSPGPDPLERRQGIWSRHWATGAPHSCAGSYGELYGGAIAEFWRTVHADTPVGARLLDIATGSGAVPRLLMRLRPTLDCRYEAVDLALTRPMEASALRFHSGVRAEALPFADASFDLVTSQYGLEYSDLARSVVELLRVRGPSGRVALVLHHAASRPVRLARIELAHLDWLQSPDGLVGAAADMLRPLAQARTAEGRSRLAGDAAAEAARTRFNAAQDALRQRAQAADGADVLGEAQDAIATVLGQAVQVGEAPAHAGLLALQEQLSDNRLRLQELRDCALDDTTANSLCARLSTAGLRTTLALLHEGPHLMGWALRADPA